MCSKGTFYNKSKTGLVVTYLKPTLAYFCFLHPWNQPPEFLEWPHCLEISEYWNPHVHSILSMSWILWARYRSELLISTYLRIVMCTLNWQWDNIVGLLLKRYWLIRCCSQDLKSIKGKCLFDGEFQLRVWFYDCNVEIWN